MFKFGKKKKGKAKKAPEKGKSKKSKKQAEKPKEKQKGLSRDEINEFLDKGYLKVVTVIQLAGSPKEYLVRTLKEYIEKLKKERGQDKSIIVLKEEYAKPKKHKGLFEIFVELEMLVRDASELAFFCFDYMPTSIEITEPEKFIYNSPDFAAFFNDLLARLHRLDLAIKNLSAENTTLKRNASLLLRNNVIINLMQKTKTLEELSKNTGIPKDQLSPFLEKLIKEGWIKKDKEAYALAKKI